MSNYNGQSFAAYSLDNQTGAIGDLVYHEEYENEVELRLRWRREPAMGGTP